MYKVIGSLEVSGEHVFVFEDVPCNIGIFVDEQLTTESDGRMCYTERGLYFLLGSIRTHVPFVNVGSVDCYNDGLYIETVSLDYKSYVDYDLRLLGRDSANRLGSLLLGLLSTDNLFPTYRENQFYLSKCREVQIGEIPEQLIELPNIELLSGYEFEDFVSNLFQRMGYTVEQTPKSRDQGVDLIIANRDIRAAIQTKRYRESVGNSAIQEVFTGMYHYRCTHAAVLTTSSFSQSAQELAQSTGVRLWDGSYLKLLYKLSRFGVMADDYSLF